MKINVTLPFDNIQDSQDVNYSAVVITQPG